MLRAYGPVLQELKDSAESTADKSWLAKFQSEVFKISQRHYQGHSSDIKKKTLK